MLDGEGGFAVWANAIPATRSLDLRALPMGLAHNVKLKRAIKKDQIVSYDDVDLVNDLDVVALRREHGRALPVPGQSARGLRVAMLGDGSALRRCKSDQDRLSRHRHHGRADGPPPGRSRVPGHRLEPHAGQGGAPCPA